MIKSKRERKTPENQRHTNKHRTNQTSQSDNRIDTKIG